MTPELVDVQRPTWRLLFAEAGRRLDDQQAARWLLEEVSGGSWAALVAELDAVAPEAAADRLDRLLARRLAGEPLQHVLGHWSFAGVELVVDRRALIPRPETELVVEVAVGELARRRRAGTRLAPSALDLGTGSGAIACALVVARPDLQVVAVDRSPAALELAAENRSRLAPRAAERLSLRRGSWYEPVGDLVGGVDLVVSNPPYLASAEWEGLDPIVRDHDPLEALVAGPTGLEAIAAVLQGAPGVLAREGAVVLEIAPDQDADAVGLARSAGAESAEVLADLTGRPRVLLARW